MVIFYEMRQASRGDSVRIYQEFQNRFSNQEKSYREPENFDKWIHFQFLISVSKIARATVFTFC